MSANNVQAVRGGAIHAPNPASPVPAPLCRTGAQNQRGTRYCETDKLVTCKACGPDINGLIKIHDYRAGYVEATLSRDCDAGDIDEVLATATRARQGWTVRTPFGHTASEWIAHKPDALKLLGAIAADGLRERLGSGR